MTVPELTPDALHLAAARVERSRTVEQFVYRETELDEIWRLADLAVSKVRAEGASTSRGVEEYPAIADLVHRAHDLLGQNEDTRGAACALRDAAVLLRALGAER
jgi:hypothetical protein